MKVELLGFTRDADNLLVFAKQTRHLSKRSFEEVIDFSQREIDEELEYVFSTISSCWEFVSYSFLISGVTRAFTHQLVRHRIGVSFAQESHRLGVDENWDCYLPPEIARDEKLLSIYKQAMERTADSYTALLGHGARPQDARGVLPTNILTSIVMKINLRALSEMLAVRLCVRAQGEFQEVAKRIKELVIDIHPFTERVLQPNCLLYGVCKFPRFGDCPISKAYPILRDSLGQCKEDAEKMHEEILGFDPQPEKNK